MSCLPLCSRWRRGAICASALPRHGPIWTAAIPAALIALACGCISRSPAAEYVLGGRDPGVYMNEGIQIAQSRSLVTTDRVAAAVPASTRDLFFPYARRSELLQRPLHGIPSARSRSRHGDRPVSAGISDLDCDRVRAGWRHRHAAGHRMVGDSRRLDRVFRRQAPDRPASGRRGGRLCFASTSFRRGMRAIRIPKSSRRRCSLRRCSPTPTRTKTRIDFSGRSRRRCSASRCSPDFPSCWPSAPPSRRRCSRTWAAIAPAPDSSSRWRRGLSPPACTTRRSCGRTSAGRSRTCSRSSRFTWLRLRSPRSPRARLIWASRTATSVRGDSHVSADRADRDRDDRRHLRAVLSRAGRPAGSARRACRSHVRGLVFHARRVRSRPGRLCTGGVAIVLARAGADSDDHDAGDVLLLQDADLARALLARAPVSHRDPAGRAHLRSRGDLRAGLDDEIGIRFAKWSQSRVHGDRRHRHASCSATDTCLRRCRFENTSSTRA